MSPEQILVADLVAVLLLLTLSGLAWRARLTHCRAFTFYLAAALLTNRLVVWLPQYFFTFFFWTIKESVQCGLTLVVALSLISRDFGRWPRARRLAWALSIAGAGVWLLWSGLDGDVASYRDFAAIVLPRLQAAAAFGFAALFTTASWYRLPLPRLHRMIVLGFGLYLVAYALILAALHWSGWSGYSFLSALEPAVYGASVGLWALGAWGPASLHDDALERLWWLLVSPAQRVYFEELEATIASRDRAIVSTVAEAQAAEEAGDLQRASRLRAALATFAERTASRRDRTLLSMRRRALSAIER
jgi:hypothetical protein